MPIKEFPATTGLVVSSMRENREKPNRRDYKTLPVELVYAFRSVRPVRDSVSSPKILPEV